MSVTAGKDYRISFSLKFASLNSLYSKSSFQMATLKGLLFSFISKGSVSMKKFGFYKRKPVAENSETVMKAQGYCKKCFHISDRILYHWICILYLDFISSYNSGCEVQRYQPLCCLEIEYDT